VFRVEGLAGQSLVAEVYARRLNSPVDSLVRIFDSSGKVLACRVSPSHSRGDPLQREAGEGHGETMTSARVRRASSDGLQIVRLEHGGIDELFITVVPGEGGDFASMFTDAITAVREADATILRQDVFGIPSLRTEAHEALNAVCRKIDWPITWLEEGSNGGVSLIGTHLQAVAGAPVQRIRQHGRVIGSVFENGFARYCRLGDVRAGDPSLPRNEQARRTFGDVLTALNEAEMDFSNVVRT